MASGRAEQDDRPPQRPAARRSTPATRRARIMSDARQGRLPHSQRPPRGVLRSVRQRLPLRPTTTWSLRADGQEVRADEHDLPQRQRRRRRDVLHPAMRRQQQAKRRLAAAEARAGQTVAACGLAHEALSRKRIHLDFFTPAPQNSSASSDQSSGSSRDETAWRRRCRARSRT